MGQPIIQPHLERLGNVEWESHLKSWKRSGLSKAEYCRRKHISYHAFNLKQKKLKKPEYSSPITLVKLEESDQIAASFQHPPVSSQYLSSVFGSMISVLRHEIISQKQVWFNLSIH